MASFANFDDLLRGRPSEPLSVQELASLIPRIGRTIIQGPAGIGKTTLTRTLSELNEKNGIKSIVFDLSMISSLGAEGLIDDDDDDEALQGVLLSRFADRISNRTIFYIDALDLMAPDRAGQVLRVIEEISNLYPEWSAVVLDRVTRRPIRVERWLLVGWTAVHPESEQPWADLPFYQEIQGRNFPEPDDAIEAAFRRSGVSDATLDDLGAQILASRGRGQGDLIDPAELNQKDQTLAGLESDGLLTRRPNDRFYPTHSLLSDFLVSRILAKDPQSWNKETLQKATFDGSRLEPLDLTLGQIETDQVDRFVEEVDDWNYRASAALVAFDFAHARRISDRMRAGLLTLLCVRKFSRVSGISSAAKDALDQHGGDYAHQLLKVSSIHKVESLAHESTGLSTDWPEFLEALRGPGRSDEELASYWQRLATPDDLLGWARANRIACGASRSDLAPHAANLVRAEDVSMAWRAVHALAAANDEDSAQLLCETVSATSSRWVKYGAVQSFLVVLNSLPDTVAEPWATKFFDSVRTGLEEIHTRRAILRALNLRSQTDMWRILALRLVGELIEFSASDSEREDWLRASLRLRTRRNN